MSKTGLVLEGGAMRGLYTAGVLDVFLENNIEVDIICSVSAGAAFGCNYKSKQLGRVLRYNTKYAGDSRMGSLSSLVRTGDIFNTEFAYHTLPDKLDVFDSETFYNNHIDFYVVVTNIETGKPEYKLLSTGSGSDVEWIQASASMPVVSNPVEIEGNKYLDGGISDPIPIKWMKEQGIKKNIVILTRPEGYIKPPESKMFGRILKKEPNLVSAIEKRSDVYNRSVIMVEEDHKLGNTIIIRPSIDLKLKRTEKSVTKLEAMYDLGRYDAMEQLEAIKCFIND